MFPKIISIGGFFLPTYGVLVALGFLCGLWIAGRLARRQGIEPQLVTDLGVYIALAGLAGAKLLMLAYDLPYYAEHPREILSLFQAGGVFYGGLIAALAAAVWYLRRHHLPFLPVADAFAPGLALGHAIGRLGCFAAGCCWGMHCDRSWAVVFTSEDANKLVGVPLNVPLHPTQIYEAIAEFVIFGVLYRRFLRPHAPGAIIGWYLILYPAARFIVEFFRAHEQANPLGGPLSMAQWITVGLAGLGVWLLFKGSHPAVGRQPIETAGT